MAEETVTLSKKDLEQDAVIAELRDEIQVLKNTKDTISFSAIRPITAVLMVLYGLSTGALGLYVNNVASPIASDVEDLAKDVSQLEIQNNNFALSTSVNELKIAVAGAASKDSLNTIDSEVKELSRELRSFETSTAERIAEVEKTQSNTLTTEAVDSRIEGMKIIVDSNHRQSIAGDENVRGQFERIILGRMQPQIDIIRDQVIKIESATLADKTNLARDLQKMNQELADDLEQLRSATQEN